MGRQIVTRRDVAAPPAPRRPSANRQRSEALPDPSSRAATPTRPRTTGDLSAAGGSGADGYVDRLLKYIPAEAVGLYLALDGIVRSATDDGADERRFVLLLATAFGTVFTWLYLARIEHVTRQVQKGLSTCAFVIWVFAIGGPFATFSWYEPYFGSLAIVAATSLIPLVEPER